MIKFTRPNIYILLFMTIILIFSLINCSGTGTTNNNSTYKTEIKEELCNYVADNWVGVFIRYKGPDDFYNKCSIIDFDTEMELAQNVRALIPDGHFYIGLSDFHDDNKFEEAKIIPIVTTYDIYDNAVIAKSNDKYRQMGLKEGNIILKINGIEVIYYVESIMKLLPQSSYYESKEKAYRLLFTSVLKPYKNYYFEIPFLETDKPAEIMYLDTETGEINNISVEFEPIVENLPNDFLSISLNDYWSIQRYYDVTEDNYCQSQNEFANLINIDGKNWLVYHPFQFMYDFGDDEGIKANFTCYSKFVDKTDYFILDLRDSVGGTFVPIAVMMGLLGADKPITYTMAAFGDGELYGEQEITLEPEKVEGLTCIGEKTKIYVWANSIAGSAADIFLHATRNSNEDHILYVGKPSAGRVQAISNRGVIDYAVTMPFSAIYDEIGMQLEGRPIFPDYYFDVEAKDYTSPDKILKSYVNFIKSNNL